MKTWERPAPKPLKHPLAEIEKLPKDSLLRKYLIADNASTT